MAIAPASVSSSSRERVIAVPVARSDYLMPSESSFDRRALRRRRLRITFFFARTVIHFLWFDFFLRLSPFRVFRSPWIPRWRKLASHYKQVAIDAQGLWVKLGQFLSTRVDLLPMEITQALE